MATSKTQPKPRTRRGSGTMQFLTQEELKHLFAVIKERRDKAIFLLAYRHGLRASEIGLLQRTDVDLKQGRITIHRLKGSLSGIYPLECDQNLWGAVGVGIGRTPGVESHHTSGDHW